MQREQHLSEFFKGFLNKSRSVRQMVIRTDLRPGSVGTPLVSTEKQASDQVMWNSISQQITITFFGFKYIPIIAAMLLLASPLHAWQAYDELQVNNIRASVHADGIFFGDRELMQPVFEVPAGSGKSTIFAAALWMSGYDQSGNLHTSAQTYRQSGTDYHPGPLKPGTAEAADTIKWNKLWKISRKEIEYHRQNWDREGYNMPDVIRNWPAHGEDGFSDVLAPFYDRNVTGKYEPDKGDYPFMKGDEAIFFIFNDRAAPNSLTGGRSFGMEVSGFLYGYNEPHDEAVNNSLFLTLYAINRSSYTYYDVNAGFWADLDIGNPWNDLMGTDTSLNMYYNYVGEEYDNQYGNSPPAQGVVFLNHKLSHTSTFFNNQSPDNEGDPMTAADYHNYLRGMKIDSTYREFEGRKQNFAFHGNPCTGKGWNAIDGNREPKDKRGLGSVMVERWKPGEAIRLDLAFVFARSENNLQSVCELKNIVPHVKDFFRKNHPIDDEENPSWIRQNSKDEQTVKIFPNPAETEIEIMFGLNNSDIHVLVRDLQGRIVQEDVMKHGENRLAVTDLAPGMYIVEVKNGKETGRGRLIIKN